VSWTGNILCAMHADLDVKRGANTGWTDYLSL
jgi:hypothetical protein